MNHKDFFKKVIILVVLFVSIDIIISVILLNGLNRFYGINHKSDLLINGSSMVLAGFNRSVIEQRTKMKTANFSHEGVSIEARLAMIKLFFNANSNRVKTVIYEVNPVIFSGTRTSDNVYTIFYPFLDNKSFNNYIKENASKKEYYVHKIIRTKRFESRLIRYALFGYLGKYEKVKAIQLDTSSLKPVIAQKGKVSVKMESSKIDTFEETMDLIESNNTNIILVMMPMYKAKLETFDNDGLKDIRNYFEKLCSSRENIRFLDFNRDSIITNASYFSDPLHCNFYGQRIVSDMISSYLTDN